MARGGNQSKNLRPGKKMGRPPKATIPLDDGPTKKGIASQVLAMDGTPDHVRKCSCHVCLSYPKNCTCFEQCGDCQKLKENCSCQKYRPTKIRCAVCRTIEDHKLCQCELCGWWQLLDSTDRRIVFDSRRYLTDRRDGKPAQGVFVGDTRENRPDLDFGNLLLDPEIQTPEGKSGKTRKPN